MTPIVSRAALCAAFAALSSCGGSAPAKSTTATPQLQRAAAQTALRGAENSRCDSTVGGREISEYDTSGDEIADVRKVFVRVGDANQSRLVLICREADVNHDGVKDVVRVYDDEGRPLREDADRNFDGRVDQATLYQSGEIVVNEFDNNFDGKIDGKVYYEKGKPVRAERDLAGRSTETQWRPDRWEYFESGKLVRMGTDLDGDMKVDHWDRDMAWKRAQDVAKAQAETPTASE
ncbi:MAG: hypothetical protein ABW321_00400 [Polyangiales bacterium]